MQAFLLALSAFAICYVNVGAAAPCYPALFVFGDSLLDTGNGKIMGDNFSVKTGQVPYGETFPGYPFFRFSDGHLLVDFLASFIGVPLIKPCLDSLEDFSGGVNYAVSGSTAQDVEFLRENLIFTLTNSSLDVQIGWHLDLLVSNASLNKPSTNAFSNGLYVLEFGGNDYMRAMESDYEPSYITSMFVPLVIAKIRNATEVLYANGARNFLFLAITPLGCLPSLLSASLLGSKDGNGCLQDANTLSYIHGVSLLNLAEDLRLAHADATFIFADYYGAYTQVIQNKAAYGFSNSLDACCGAGPSYPYNYEWSRFCNYRSGTGLATLCSDPNVFLSWDGIHFTDKFNSVIFNLTIATGSYLNPEGSFSDCLSATS